MLQTKLFSALAASALLPVMAHSQSLIVNEYNGVTDTKFFDLAFDESFEGRDYGLFFDATAGAGTYIPTSANADDDGSDPRWDLIPTAVDMQGRILGNGGNWIELVVTEDNLDLRGWSLEWSNADTPPDNAGTVTFSNDARWSNLRSGTIVTIIETPDDLVPTLPVTFPDGTTGTAINVDTDFNTTPDTGDFSVNAWLGDATMFTTGDWKVDNDDWQVTIKDDLGATVQGPIGEDVQGFGVNSREIARLEADREEARARANEIREEAMREMQEQRERMMRQQMDQEMARWNRQYEMSKELFETEEAQPRWNEQLAQALGTLRERGIDVDAGAVSEETLNWSLILEEGTGDSPEDKIDTVSVHATGWLPDGEQFWSSYDAPDGQEAQPAIFTLNRVVQGWGLAVESMRVGEKRMIVIPSEFAYGARGRSDAQGNEVIAPNTALIFELELIALP